MDYGYIPATVRQHDSRLPTEASRGRFPFRKPLTWPFFASGISTNAPQHAQKYCPKIVETDFSADRSARFRTTAEYRKAVHVLALNVNVRTPIRAAQFADYDP